MARAVGQYEAMHRPANMKMFPYVIYRASVGSKSPRDSHKRYDGMVIDKRDPWLRTHWPPWEFGCNCDLQNCTAKKAETLGTVKPMSDPEDVKIESESGFSFDPAKAFEEYDLTSIKDEEVRSNIHDGLLAFCQKGNFQASFYGSHTQKLLPESYREPENIEEIREFFRKVEKRNEEDPGNISVSVGPLLPEHAAKLGLKDFNGEIIFHHPGTAKAGSKHWQKHHNDTLNEDDAIDLFRLTIWNPNADVREDVNGRARRLSIFVKDAKTGKISNIWVVKNPAGILMLELIDSWTAPRKYIDNLEKK